MNKDNVVGYMLGDKNHVVVRGDQWCNAGTPVYICANKDVARAILEKSQQNALEPENIIWTTIYRVQAENLQIYKYEHDLMWTTQGNKIIVDEPVFYRDASKISEQRLLRNAAQIRARVLNMAQSNPEEKRR